MVRCENTASNHNHRVWVSQDACKQLVVGCGTGCPLAEQEEGHDTRSYVKHIGGTQCHLAAARPDSTWDQSGYWSAAVYFGGPIDPPICVHMGMGFTLIIDNVPSHCSLHALEACEKLAEQGMPDRAAAPIQPRHIAIGLLVVGKADTEVEPTKNVSQLKIDVARAWAVVCTAPEVAQVGNSFRHRLERLAAANGGHFEV